MEGLSSSQMTFLVRLVVAAGDMLKHRPKLDFVDWAPRFVVNPDGTPFEFRPTQKPIARDLFDPSIPSGCVEAFSGFGKTYLFGAAIAYVISQLKTAAAAMMPNQNLAEDWGNEELKKVFDSTPAIDRMHKVRDLKRYKRWLDGGELFLVGANSSGMLRRLQASFLYADEIDAIEQDASDEGDKLAQFFKRGRGRKEQFKWSTSYPSLKGASKIDALYDQSDQCRWYVDCARCGEKWVMHTSQMIWTPGKPETARIVCPKCETKHDDAARFEMAWNGRYLNRWLQPPEPGVARGYHVGCMSHVGEYSSAYSGYLHEVAAEIEKGRKSENPEKARRVFVNTMDAESYAEQVDRKPEAHELYLKRERFVPEKMLPEGVLFLSMGVDAQKNRLEVQIVGFGKNAEKWPIAYRVFQGSPMSPQTWRPVDELRAKVWNHPIDPRGLKVVVTMVDSGKWQDHVFAYTHPRSGQRVFACKGAKAIDRVLMDGKPTLVGNKRIRQYHIGTHEAKDVIYCGLDLPQPKAGEDYPRGYIHVPDIAEFGPEAGGEATGYFEMLTAEDSKMKRSTQTGEFVRFFENANRARNEALDTFVYALGGERLMNPQYDKILEKMKKAQEGVK